MAVGEPLPGTHIRVCVSGRRATCGLNLFLAHVLCTRRHQTMERGMHGWNAVRTVVRTCAHSGSIESVRHVALNPDTE